VKSASSIRPRPSNQKPRFYTVWVKVRPQLANDRCPFVPQLQTLIRVTAWSVSCQIRAWGDAIHRKETAARKAAFQQANRAFELC